MIDINLLINSWYFKTQILKKWDVLFDEWDKNENLYIILNWELQVEKYLSKELNETKVLAYLKKNEIFWEASLNWNWVKEVKIKSKRETHLLYINAKIWLEEFSKKYPTQAVNLLKYIIHLWNKRLIESNRLIAATYKMSKEIMKITKISNKEIFNLIEILKKITQVDYILYLEKNQVLENYMTVRYDTREKWKILDKVIEFTDSRLDLLSLRIWNYFTYIQNISIWTEDLWILYFFKKDENFTDNDKKTILLTCLSLAWVIKQKKINDEERDIDYMNG